MKKLIVYLLLVISLCIVYFNTNAQTKWSANKKYIHSDTTIKKESKQCWGTTKKGERCKRKINANEKFCYQHKYQSE